MTDPARPDARAPGGPETGPWSEDDRTRSHDVLRLSREGSVDGDSMELLTQALEDDPAPLVRSRAAMALGKLGDTEAVPALASALGDSNSTVRTQSVQALAQIGGDRALAVLGDTLLSHHDPRTRQLAALALRREGSDQAMVYLQAAASETGVEPTGVSIPTGVPETGAVDR